MSVHGLGFTFRIEGFKMVPLSEGEWNGEVSTRIHVLHSLPPLKGEATTVMKYAFVEEAFSPNMTTAIYQMPSGSVFIENFAAARTFVTVPFSSYGEGVCHGSCRRLLNLSERKSVAPLFLDGSKRCLHFMHCV